MLGNTSFRVSALSLAAVVFLSGCASITGKKRVFLGAGMGAGAGAMSGILLSPNQESRGLNGLFFGLGGALVGGLTALLSDQKSEIPEPKKEMKALDRDLGKWSRQFEVLPAQVLPEFLKNRIQPLVIEEYLEADSVSDDGTLHEPHKAYRVKNPGELFARPGNSADGAPQ